MAATYATLADPVSAVVNLLSNNWSAVASGVGTTPTIDESWDIGKHNLKSGDIIRCYETASSHNFLGIGKGVNSAAADVTGKTSKHLGKKGLLSKAFSGLFGAIKGIGPMVAGLAASATAGAKSILDRAKQSLGLGKDKITKQPKIDSFKSMPKQPTGGLTSKPSAALTERSQVKPVRTKVKTLTKAVTKGGGTSATSKVGSIGSKIANVSKKFPKLGALLKFPGIGMVIGVAELAALLLSNKSKDEKIQGVAGILMGMGNWFYSWCNCRRYCWIFWWWSNWKRISSMDDGC